LKAKEHIEWAKKRGLLREEALKDILSHVVAVASDEPYDRETDQI